MDAKVVRCKTLAITTNGLARDTEVKVDGELVSGVTGLFLEFDAKEPKLVATVETVDNKENIELAVFKFEAEKRAEGVDG